MGLLELILHGARLLRLNRLDPTKVRITVEFLDRQGYYAAECALRQQVGLTTDPRMVDAICSEREFEVLGIKFRVPAPREQYLPACGCPSCEAQRAVAHVARMPEVSAYEMNRRNCDCPYCV